MIEAPVADETPEEPVLETAEPNLQQAFRQSLEFIEAFLKADVSRQMFSRREVMDLALDLHRILDPIVN